MSVTRTRRSIDAVPTCQCVRAYCSQITTTARKNSRERTAEIARVREETERGSEWKGRSTPLQLSECTQQCNKLWWILTVIEPKSITHANSILLTVVQYLCFAQVTERVRMPLSLSSIAARNINVFSRDYVCMLSRIPLTTKIYQCQLLLTTNKWQVFLTMTQVLYELCQNGSSSRV